MTEKQATASWQWHWAHHDDEYWSVPFDSREAAIEAGRLEIESAGFFVAQAINSPIRLSAWIGADELFDQAEERIFDSDRASSEYDDEIFSATKEQRHDLAERIKKACDEWQDAHGLSFHCSTFESMTAPERVPALEAAAGNEALTDEASA